MSVINGEVRDEDRTVDYGGAHRGLTCLGVIQGHRQHNHSIQRTYDVLFKLIETMRLSRTVFEILPLIFQKKLKRSRDSDHAPFRDNLSSEGWYLLWSTCTPEELTVTGSALVLGGPATKKQEQWRLAMNRRRPLRSWFDFFCNGCGRMKAEPLRKYCRVILIRVEWLIGMWFSRICAYSLHFYSLQFVDAINLTTYARRFKGYELKQAALLLLLSGVWLYFGFWLFRSPVFDRVVGKRITVRNE